MLRKSREKHITPRAKISPFHPAAKGRMVHTCQAIYRMPKRGNIQKTNIHINFIN
jgi:hypothetical protein